MYVLVDIEWVTNDEKHICPTQLAALRVNDYWDRRESFYRRISPRDSSFHDWGQMGYTGGDAEDFLCADSLSCVMRSFFEWLRDDDVLCLWAKDPAETLRLAVSLGLKCSLQRKVVVLQDHLERYKSDKQVRGWNPKKIANRMGYTAAVPSHRADNDVENIRLVLLALEVPAEELCRPVVPREEKRKELPLCFVDADTGLTHAADCPRRSARGELVAQGKNFLLRKDIPFCNCLDEKRRKQRRACNMDIVARSQCNYIYAETSSVFHRRSCPLPLRTTAQIMGSVYYSTCEKTGRHPCKVCHPDAGERIEYGSRKKPAVEKQRQTDHLLHNEKKALQRFQQARTEWDTLQKKGFASAEDKQDRKTLTNPGCAFFAAAGYETFHLRKCSKLDSLSQLKGFSTYREAIRGGHKPCRYCKPTSKYDVCCAVPLNSRTREDESVADIVALCTEKGYPCETREGELIFSTPVGKWRLGTNRKPYQLQHINLVAEPGNKGDYHMQPRIFLSMQDAFYYVHRHDLTLLQRQQGRACVR